MNIAEEIRNKRNETGLSVKEFADAICLGKNGDKMFRAWENGETTPSEEILSKIMCFASIVPFKDKKRKHSFKFIDLFVGIQSREASVYGFLFRNSAGNVFLLQSGMLLPRKHTDLTLVNSLMAI